ncbi:hypothetical protein TIFTF001_045667 [Ficus carica]|uniref:Uncharacterized protein n=1 Tax=Ficus carica TaxID=3494 RepID=A0AA87YTE0_FICCA|nr:hypothetical protein TIFTF001_045667 [Ficus carica]
MSEVGCGFDSGKTINRLVETRTVRDLRSILAMDQMTNMEILIRVYDVHLGLVSFIWRPEMQRIPFAAEERPSVRCSKCRNLGQKKRTCKNQVPSALGESSSKKMKSCQKKPN